MAIGASIASCTRSCCFLFQQLRGALQTADLEGESQLGPDDVTIQSSRFDLWARNIAALHPAHLPSSLEHRLRDDGDARETVKSALKYVEESLELALSIVSGKTPNEMWDIESEWNADPLPPQQTSELIELSLAINDRIANLPQLSMIIRKKPEIDEYLRAASQIPMDSDIDIIRVGDKFPAVNERGGWLGDRLGKAITRRRQYLLARKYHQERMQQVHEIEDGPDGKTVWTGEKASTYQPNEKLQEHDPLANTLQEFQRPSKIAHTEYAESSKGRDGNAEILRTPPLPKYENGTRAKYGEYFECPYCRRTQRFEQKSDWKKHVFTDLRPYICTFEPCGLNMFESQHQWFNHELQFHRPQWACQHCAGSPAMSRPDLECHYKDNHKRIFEDGNVNELLDNSRLERIDASSCPLCTEYGAKYQRINQSSRCDVSVEQFQRHLGDHMEQLALVALPPEDTEDEEQEDGDEKSEDDEEDWDGRFYTESEIRLTVQRREATLGKEHLDTLSSMSTLANMLYTQAKFPQAEVINRQVLQLRERELRKEHPKTLRSMSDLAYLLYKQAKFTEAEVIYQQLVQPRERVLGKEHLKTLSSLNSLANLLYQQAKFTEAEVIYQQVVQLRERVLGKEHPKTLNSLNSLAKLLRHQDRLMEAEAIYRQVLQLRERALGKEHQKTLDSLNNLAKLLRHQGRFAEAKSILDNQQAPPQA